MSADNWGICPRCNKEHAEKVKRMKLKAGEAYGKVSPDEYLALLGEVETISKVEEIERTLCEDYECLIDKYGLLHISYSCSCTQCGFEHNFKHEERLSI